MPGPPGPRSALDLPLARPDDDLVAEPAAVAVDAEGR